MKKILILFLFLILCCPQAALAKKKAAAIPAGSGYVGTLPNITGRFNKAETQEAMPSFEYKDGFNDQDSIKPAPRNNPAFINIIMKKDKNSQYINDLNYIISIVENLQTSIEAKQDVQKFNAQSYFLKENVEYFRDKYKNKAEESYISYNKLMQLNSHVQAVSQLRLESEVFSPYVTEAKSGNLFSKNNINVQLDYLLAEIKQTLVVLKEDK
ncbi:MAG: hypothetical protein WCY19_00955 [Candidatus Gastranaerophilaceae bacterium]